MPNVHANLNGLAIAEEAFEAFVAGIAPLQGFSTDFNDEAAEKNATIRVPVVRAIVAESFNTYETASSGGNVDPVEVALSIHKKATWDLTDLTAGKTPVKVFVARAREAMKGLALTVFQEVTNLFITDNIGVTNDDRIVQAPASFDLDDVADLDALLTKRNAVGPRTMLATVDYATALKKDNQIQDVSAYGSDDVIRTGEFRVPMYGVRAFETNALSSTVTNEHTGVIMAVPSAAAIAMRPVVPQPNKVLNVFDTITDGNGVTVGYREHYAPATGKLWATVEVLMGKAIVKDGASGRVGAVRILSE
jgi:hypothetical protein